MPEAISQVRTVDEARLNVEEALQLAPEWRIAEGRHLQRRQG